MENIDITTKPSRLKSVDDYLEAVTGVVLKACVRYFLKIHYHVI